jgi:hypothetical protein
VRSAIDLVDKASKKSTITTPEKIRRLSAPDKDHKKNPKNQNSRQGVRIVLK